MGCPPLGPSAVLSPAPLTPAGGQLLGSGNASERQQRRGHSAGHPRRPRTPRSVRLMGPARQRDAAQKGSLERPSHTSDPLRHPQTPSDYLRCPQTPSDALRQAHTPSDAFRRPQTPSDAFRPTPKHGLEPQPSPAAFQGPRITGAEVPRAPGESVESWRSAGAGKSQ